MYLPHYFITLASGLYNSLYYRTSRDLNNNHTKYLAQTPRTIFTFSKISSANFNSCGAIYRPNYETFTGLQNTSSPLTDAVKPIQIDQ